MKSKYQKKKNKSWVDCHLTDHQRLIQTEDSKWALMVNNIRATKQLPVTVQSSPLIPMESLLCT